MSNTVLPRLWINAHRFGAHVLRAGDEPWAIPEQLGLFYRELQDWLALDVVLVDLQPALSQWLAQESLDLRSVDDLEDVLSDGRLHEYLAEGLSAVLGCGIQQPVALGLPGAGALLNNFVGGNDFNEDMFDDAAIALTGMLRNIYSTGLSALLVNECNRQALAFYTPLVNVAQHYESPLLLAFADELDEAPAGFSITFDTSAVYGGRYCEFLGSVAGDAGVADFIYTQVPEDASADAALAQLAELRS